MAPIEGGIPRTQHGLLDSVALSRDWYAGEQPRRADHLVGIGHSYVLLAPGGGGKTALVNELKCSEPESISIDLRLDGQRSLFELLDRLSSSEPTSSDLTGGTVFIDAIDEALHVDPNIGYVLVQLMGRPEAKRILWRFTCRPASWTVDLTNGLRGALPSFQELELLPLSLASIHEIAGSDTDEFLAAVEDARLTRMLALPLHAFNLLQRWRGSGLLPASRSEAMHHAVSGMLTETSATRLPGQVDDHRRGLVAERLAAISFFCGVRTFALSPVTPPPTGAASIDIDASLAVNAVPTDSEPDMPGLQLSVADIREVLGTALFAAAGQGAVAFVHQSYTEFLAAAYLKRRGVAGQRLVSVLGAGVNGLVPGPMVEVLGWLLASGSPVPEGLIADNAKQLLSTAGLELVGDQVRERVVEALLQAAAVGAIDEGWSADTSSLSHPGLAVQLHDAAQRAANHWVVFWICRIARQCAVAEAADDLLDIALAASWPAPMRAEAVRGFAEVAPRDRMVELEPLLDLEAEQDPADEILAAALRAVLPDAVGFTRIRQALRPRRIPSYVGDYYQLLRELPPLVPEDDVLPMLTDMLRRRPENSDRDFDGLIDGLLRRAWQLSDAPRAAVLGAALGSELSRRPLTVQSVQLPWEADDNPDIRRAMATAALAAHEAAFVTVLDLRILIPSDIGWLIDWMRTAPSEVLGTASVTLRACV